MSSTPDPMPTGPMSLDAAVNVALNYCNVGWLDHCDHICAKVLEANPLHVQALTVRGISACRRRDNNLAVSLLARAAQRSPTFADAFHHLGVALLFLNRRDEAEASFRRALELREDFPEALAGLAEARQLAGDAAAAFPLFERAVTLKPNYSPGYIGYSLLCFDRDLPPGADAGRRRPLPEGAPLLTMASLASYGRFAHTVQEYVAVRLYAEKYGIAFATPDWVGQRFFMLDDPQSPAGLQPQYENWRAVREELAQGLDGDAAQPLANRDLFLGGSPVDMFRVPWRDRVRGWLTPRPCWSAYLDPCVAALRARGDTLVAVHIRQTDWWDQAYTPLALYLSWLDQIWPSLHRPVLFICTDAPEIIGEFARFQPMTAADFPIRWQGLDYLQDYYALTQADIVAISTGAFARMAAGMNCVARQFLRPNADNSALETYEPWS